MTGAFVGIEVSESGLTLAVHQSDHRFECAVDPATAEEKVEHLGTTYYFCSAGCRKAFQGDPGRYLARGPQSGHTSHGGHSR